MIITVQIDTDQPLSQNEKDILAVLSGSAAASAAEPAKKATAEPVQKTAKKTATPKKAVEPEPKPEPEPEPEGDSTLMETALSLASDMLSSDRPRVMTALKDVGAGRVSEIPEDSLQQFIDALTD